MKGDYSASRMIWNGIDIEVRWQPDWLAFDDETITGHLEVRSVAPERAPLPITSTGYRSHFIHAEAIEAEGGPVAYVAAWLAHEVRTRQGKANMAPQQLALF